MQRRLSARDTVQPPRCAGTGGVWRSPGLGAADGRGTSKISGFTQGVGWPQSAWGRASFGGQAKGSECQVVSPGNRGVGGTLTPNHRPPAPRETGREKQDGQRAGAGWGDRRPRADTPAQLSAASPMACRLCTLSWASAASDSQAQAPSLWPLPSVSYQSLRRCLGAPCAACQHVLSVS